MIDIDEAIRIVLESARDFGTEHIPLNHGIGRVLKEKWYCDRDLPPYDRVTMDGIAINFEGARGLDSLKIERIIAAGDPQTALSNPSHCVEIMTGASMPIGADTVIRYEDVTIRNGSATVNREYRKSQNIHFKGEDRKKGELLVSENTLLSASEIGVGASIGKGAIEVAKNPRVIIASTGNELVEVHETPLPHQIRKGNVYRIQSTLRNLGILATIAHIKDDEKETADKLRDYLVEYDCIIFSGGVSRGKFDFLPGALDQCRVNKLFHKVAQRPGKPFWFGVHPKGTTIFALPGNPVSSFMCLQIYVLDWLRVCFGLKPMDRPNAVLTQEVSFRPDLTYFLEVRLSYDHQGRILATPQKGHGSGDMANLMNGDAFIRIPRGKEIFQKGEVYPIYMYR